MMSVKKRQYMLLFTLPVTLLPLLIAGKPGMSWMAIVALVLLLVWYIMVAIFCAARIATRSCPVCPAKTWRSVSAAAEI